VLNRNINHSSCSLNVRHLNGNGMNDFVVSKQLLSVDIVIPRLDTVTIRLDLLLGNPQLNNSLNDIIHHGSILFLRLTKLSTLRADVYLDTITIRCNRYSTFY